MLFTVALQGFPKHLTIAFMNISNIFEVSSDGQTIGGIEGKFLKLISEALGFSFKLVPPPDKEWGRPLSNESWTGLVGMLMRKEADLAVGMVAISPLRAQVVDFSLPYTENHVTFVTRFPQPLPRAYTCLYPFHWTTWFGTALLLVAMPFLFWMFNRRAVTYGDALFRVFAGMLRQPLNVKAGMALNGSWWISSTVLSLSYAAVLSSVLTLPLMEPPVDTFPLLAAAVRKGTHEVYTSTGSTMAETLKRSGAPHLRYIAQQIEENGWQMPMGIPPEDLRKPGMSSLGVQVYLQLLFGHAHFAVFLVSEDPGSAYSVGFMLSKDFCCKRQLDEIVSRAVNGGLYLRLVEEQLYKRGLVQARAVEEEPGYRELGVRDVAGAGLVMMVGGALSIVVFVGEMLVGKVGNKGLS